jgi:hypothetical protein
MGAAAEGKPIIELFGIRPGAWKVHSTQRQAADTVRFMLSFYCVACSRPVFLPAGHTPSRIRMCIPCKSDRMDAQTQREWVRFFERLTADLVEPNTTLQ